MKLEIAEPGNPAWGRFEARVEVGIFDSYRHQMRKWLDENVGKLGKAWVRGEFVYEGDPDEIGMVINGEYLYFQHLSAATMFFMRWSGA